MKNKGFTLIELAVVLAIIAVLAAILTPMVTNYLDQARTARAMGDTRTIADAIRLYRRDTGFYPAYATLALARTGITDSRIMYSPGSAPDVTLWTAAVTAFSTALVTKLNTPLAGLNVNDSNPGKASYRGPYIGALDSDPWGNQYLVTSENLVGSVNRGFAISAGPNGKVDTVLTQGMTTFAASGDDIAAPIN